MDIELKEKLSNQYQQLINKYGFEEGFDGIEMNLEIKEGLSNFLKECNNPAIWCYGQHTKMLMADFVFEMKSVKYIVDENYKSQKVDGFNIIRSEDIKRKRIDGIVISSFKYRKEILDIIKRDFSNVKVLDIYKYLEQRGIFLETEYLDFVYTLIHLLKSSLISYFLLP